MATNWDERPDWARRYGEVVAKAWADPAFKRRLLADPVAVLREHGIEEPPGKAVRVVEQAEDEVLFLLPHKPGGRVSEEQLERIAGAARFNDPPPGY